MGLCEDRRLHWIDKMSVYLVLSSVVIVKSLFVKSKLNHSAPANRVPAQTRACAHRSARDTTAAAADLSGARGDSRPAQPYPVTNGSDWAFGR